MKDRFLVVSVFLVLCCGTKADWPPVVPPVQERKTDPQPIAEWCAGPRPGEDDQHRIVDGWDALLRKYDEDMRNFYPDLHFVRGKPIRLLFRADLHIWCWAADYVVGLKNNGLVTGPNGPSKTPLTLSWTPAFTSGKGKFSMLYSFGTG